GERAAAVEAAHGLAGGHLRAEALLGLLGAEVAEAGGGEAVLARDVAAHLHVHVVATVCPRLAGPADDRAEAQLALGWAHPSPAEAMLMGAPSFPAARSILSRSCRCHSLGAVDVAEPRGPGPMSSEPESARMKSGLVATPISKLSTFNGAKPRCPFGHRNRRVDPPITRPFEVSRA